MKRCTTGETGSSDSVRRIVAGWGRVAPIAVSAVGDAALGRSGSSALAWDGSVIRSGTREHDEQAGRHAPSSGEAPIDTLSAVWTAASGCG